MELKPNSKLIYFISKTSNSDVYDQFANNQYNVCSLTKDILLLLVIVILGSLGALTVATMSVGIVYATLSGLVKYILIGFGYLTGETQLIYNFVSEYSYLLLGELSLTDMLLVMCLSYSILVVLFIADKIPLMSKFTASVLSKITELYKSASHKEKVANDSVVKKIAKSIISDVKNSTCSIIKPSHIDSLAERFRRNERLGDADIKFERSKYYKKYYYDVDFNLEFWEYAGFNSFEEYKEMKTKMKGQ